MKALKGLVLIFLATACIRDVDPNTLLKDQKKLVIFSFIDTDDEVINVSVSLLDDFYNKSNQISFARNYIGNALVIIDNGIKYVKLTYNPLHQRYEASTTTFPIKQGQEYHLTVNYQSVVAKASCIVPLNDAIYYPKYIKNTEQIDGGFYNKLNGKFQSKLNLPDRFITSAIGCGSIQFSTNSTEYICDSLQGLNSSSQYFSGYIVPDTALTFYLRYSVEYKSIDVVIRLLDEPSYYQQKYNLVYKYTDPLGESYSTYSNFTNAFGVFGSSSTKKIIVNF